MTYIDKFLLLIIVSIFPMIIYFFYIAYYKNIHNEEINMSTGISSLTTLYLILKYSTIFNDEAIILSFIPIIISYILNKEKEAMLLNLFLTMYLCLKTDFSSLFIILTSLSLFAAYKINNKFNIKSNLILISIILVFINLIIFESHPFNNDLLLLILTFLGVLEVNYLIIALADDMIKYHDNYKELLREEKIRTSLFKITHEIKNPLAVCVGYLDMLEEDNLEKYQKYTKIIQNEINRTLLLLQDFSNMSKININPDIMDMNVLIEDISNNIKYLTDKKHITLDLDLIDDELYINGDYGRLTQVFINLIKNSIEAIEDNGNITVKTTTNNDNIVIKVIDNGMGIKKDQLEKIKQPFYTTKPNGTGLGVSLSHEIIYKHNGNIEYESIENQGTTVTITIPAI